MSIHRTGVVYHEKSAEHKCLWDPNYPECPERFTEILKRCEELKLLERCKRIAATPANIEIVKKYHTLFDCLEQSQHMDEAELEQLSSHYDSIYIHPSTYEASLLAAGGAINLVDAICKGDVNNGMAIIRPPGHHAMVEEFCGYCFFNNVVLAAHHALDCYKLSRILIVDWDVHHGQATQDFFYDDSRVLYFSIHRYEHGTFWPNLKRSNYDSIGNHDGVGYNVNVPLNKIGLGNTDYLAIFHQILLPMAINFNPDFVLVSAGYDAAIGDNKGMMNVTPACYAHFIKSLSNLSKGKIAAVLEGGYFLKSLSEGASLTLRALLGDTCPQIQACCEINTSVKETILDVIYVHLDHNKCFKIFKDDIYEKDMPLSKVKNIHLVEKKFLFEDEPLTIFETRNCYAAHNLEAVKMLEDDVNRLIADTNLSVPTYYMSYVATVDNTDMGLYPYDLFQNYPTNIKDKLNGLKITTLDSQSRNDNLYIHSTKQIINCILQSRSRNGIINHGHLLDKTTAVDNILKHLRDTHNIKRTVVIKFDNCTTTDNLQKSATTNEILYISVKFNTKCYEEVEDTCKHHININFQESTTGDMEYIAVWLRIVLPILYQFNPEFLVIFTDLQDIFQQKSISPALFGHLIHYLTLFANGKLLLSYSFNTGNKEETSTLKNMMKAILDIPLPLLTVNEICNRNVIKIFQLVYKLKNHWNNLDFFVKYVTTP